MINTIIINRGPIGPAGEPGDDASVTLPLLLTLLGIPSYANLTAANAALSIGKIYYDTTLQTLNIATA